MRRHEKSLEDFYKGEAWDSKLHRTLEKYTSHLCAFCGGASFAKFYKAVSRREFSKSLVYGGFTLIFLLPSYWEEKRKNAT